MQEGRVSRLTNAKPIVLNSGEANAIAAYLFDELKLFLGVREGGTCKFSQNIPMSEINFTNCLSAGVSYRSLPKDYPLPACSGRTELCHSLLNDQWVSVPSGSEDYSYTHYRKNQYDPRPWVPGLAYGRAVVL